MKAALHQELGLARADQLDRSGRGRARVGYVDDRPGGEIDTVLRLKPGQ